MFIIRFIVLLPFRILAFVLSLILTIIRVFIDITAKMSSYVTPVQSLPSIMWQVLSRQRSITLHPC